MTRFQYHPSIIERYPHIVGGIILADGLSNGPLPESLLSTYEAEQKAVIARIGDTPLSDLPSLSAWRSAFREFGMEPTKYRSAAEALLRRLTKKGDIPSINTLVDIGNLVSIRYAVPVAVVDVRAVKGTLTVHFAAGDEPFTPLGQDEPEYPEVGEVIFSDENKEVCARRWCWRQSAQSAAREDTSAAIITIEGHHDSAHEDIQQAVDDLTTLLQKYSGGSFSSGILDADTSAI